MSTPVIGSRYQLEEVVARTADAMTWSAHDTWLQEPVRVVTPDAGATVKFSETTAALREGASSHLVRLYDVGRAPASFAVFGAPTLTLAGERSPLDEEEVLAAGRSLGDAVAALHERGLVHGAIHPGTVVPAPGGELALSPWPLAPAPRDWDGPGGFGSDPREGRTASVAGDLRALGALLLGALAGPPLFSSEQVENLVRELDGRAPAAVAIAVRALTPAGRGGYQTAAELRDESTIALDAPLPSDEPVPLRAEAAPSHGPDQPEGRRTAVAVAVAVALLAGAVASGALTAAPAGKRSSAAACGSAHHGCTEPRPSAPRAPSTRATPTSPTGAPWSLATATGKPVAATFSDVRVTSPAAASAPGRRAAAPPAPSNAGPSASTSTTTAPPQTTSTTTAPPATTTSTTTSTSTTTTTSTSTTSTTTAPSSSTTTTSYATPSNGGTPGDGARHDQTGA
jgi:hypothetical protein